MVTLQDIGLQSSMFIAHSQLLYALSFPKNQLVFKLYACGMYSSVIMYTVEMT